MNAVRSTIQPRPSAMALVVLAALAAFANSLENEFVWDDPAVLGPILAVRSPLDYVSPSFWNRHAVSPREECRPIQNLSLGIDAYVWGDNSTGYRVSAVMLHAINAALAACFATRVCRRRTAGVLAGLLFALHPVNTEAVAYVKNRGELLACAFLLLAILPYTDRELAKWPPALSFLAFACALMAKMSAVVFPFLLGALLAARHHGQWRRCARHVLVFLAMAVLTLLLRTALLAPSPTWLTALSGLSPLERVCTVGLTLWTYLTMLVFPVHLCADRVLPLSSRLVLAKALGMLLAVGLAVPLLLRCYRRRPLLALALLWVAVALLPASNVKFLASRPIAEQRTYVASVGFAMFLGALSARAYVRPVTARLVVTLCVTFVALTMARNFAWKDEHRLWVNTMRTAWRNSRPHLNLGIVYNRWGLYRRAVPVLDKSVRICPQLTDGYQALGDAHRGLGDVDKALAAYREATTVSRRALYSWINIADILTASKQYPGAEAALCAALQIDPCCAIVYRNLAEVQRLTARPAEAAVSLRRAAQLDRASPSGPEFGPGHGAHRSEGATR